MEDIPVKGSVKLKKYISTTHLKVSNKRFYVTH